MEKRDSVDVEIKRAWDKSIYDNLVNSEVYKNAKVIFSFVSFKSEVDTHQIIKHALNEKKILCIPKIDSKEKGIEIYKINSLSELIIGYHKILEPPANAPRVDSSTIDLILMPGVAFDLHGGRIGYGAGFYDRFLSEMDKKVSKIALAYHFQLLENIPMEQHDVRIDGIITNEDFMMYN